MIWHSMGQKQDSIIENIMRLMHKVGTSHVLMESGAEWFCHTLQGYFADSAWVTWVNETHEFTWTDNMTTTKLYAYFITVISHKCHGISDKLQIIWLFSSLFRITTMKKKQSKLSITDPSYGKSTSYRQLCRKLYVLSMLLTICSFPSHISPASSSHVITHLIMTWEPSSPMSFTDDFK